MARVNVVFYSAYGHNYHLALAEEEGARSVDGVATRVYQVRETLPESILQATGIWEARKEWAHVPEATLESLSEADAVIFGTPTRYGNMTAQMRAFLDSTGPLWANDTLVGKIGSVFTSSNTQHGGQESTILTTHVTLLHLGMIIAGNPYSEKRLFGMDAISGGSPYGASCIAGQGSKRACTENELAIARAQGTFVGRIAKRMFG